MTPAEAGALVDALGDAFAVGDVEAVVDCFAENGSVIYAGSEQGEVAVGTAAVRLLMGNLFARDERYSWRSDSVHVVACASGYALLADVTLTVEHVADDGGDLAKESLPYRIGGLVERENDAWRWRLCHASEPTPP